MVIEQIIHKLFETKQTNVFGIILDENLIHNYELSSLDAFYRDNLKLSSITRLCVLLKENSSFTYYEVNMDNNSTLTATGVFNDYVKVNYEVPTINNPEIKHNLSLAAVTLLCVTDKVKPVEIPMEVCINKDPLAIVSSPVVLVQEECSTFLGTYYIGVPERSIYIKNPILAKIIIAKEHLISLEQAMTNLIAQ